MVKSVKRISEDLWFAVVVVVVIMMRCYGNSSHSSLS